MISSLDSVVSSIWESIFPCTTNLTFVSVLPVSSEKSEVLKDKAVTSSEQSIIPVYPSFTKFGILSIRDLLGFLDINELFKDLVFTNSLLFDPLLIGIIVILNFIIELLLIKLY